MQQRVEVIDILKGLTIFFVVFGHAVQGISTSFHLDFHNMGNGMFLAKQIVYSFHMPLFFIIAGIFIDSWLKKDVTNAVKNKLHRLALPYFIWSFVIASIMQVASKYTNGGLGYKEFLRSAYVPFSQFWFLYALFFMHIILLLCKCIFSDRAKHAFFGMSLVAYFSVPVLPHVWIIHTLARFSIFFAIGMFVLQKFDFATFRATKVQALLVFMAFVASNWLWIYTNMYMPTYEHYAFFLTSLCGSYLSVICSYAISSLGETFKSMFTWGGQSSMEIYCMHLIPLAGARIVLLKFLHVRSLWMVAIGITILAIIACYVVLQVIPYKENKLKVVFGL